MLVQPIRESLQKVDGKLGEMEKTRESAYFSAERAVAWPGSRHTCRCSVAKPPIW